MNKLQSGAFPSFPEEGWLGASKKWPRSLTGAAGVVLIRHNHPGRSLGSRPPLLEKEGNRSIPILSTAHRPLRSTHFRIWDLGNWSCAKFGRLAWCGRESGLKPPSSRGGLYFNVGQP